MLLRYITINVNEDIWRSTVQKNTLSITLILEFELAIL
jgi:hypothetical protein